MKAAKNAENPANPAGRFGISISLVLLGTLLAQPAWAVSVSLTSPGNSVIPAPARITLTASATPNAGRQIQRVDFYRGVTRIGTDSAAPYSMLLSDVPSGTYIFTAIAIDSGGSFAVSQPALVRVDNAPVVSITSPAAGSAFASGANINVTANASDPDGIIRRVEFFSGITLLGTNILPPYQFIWNNVPTGSYSLTARATDLVGLATTSDPVAIIVGTAPPAVSITAPVTGTTFVAPATITVSAVATDSDGTVARVDFFDGPVLVGSVSTTLGSSTYSIALNNVAAGTHAISARATDDQGAIGTSNTVTVTVSAAVAQMYYIHTDHLNTPRMISSSANTTVWRWDQSEPFGDSVPNADPDEGGITFDFPLRFPGQYFDRETSLHYNVARDYDPAAGRYVQSDPIGLLGGINPYTYVRNGPLVALDLYGLESSPPSPHPCDLVAQAPQPDDPCNCQRDVLVDLCKCYKDKPFDIIGRGVCVEKAKLKKSKCMSDCAPKDACLRRDLFS